MSKSILQIIQKSSVQKTAPKTTKYSKNEIILKISHHAKAIAHAKCLQWVKIKIPKNMSKSILQIIQSCSVQKTAEKRLDIREMRQFWKSAIMQRLQPMQNAYNGSKSKFQKICQNLFYKSFRVVLCKRQLKKTLNIGQMTPFLKSAIMQRLQPMQNPHFGSKI